MLCLETHQLSYHFSEKETALNSIDLHVETGSIYGFLGPNGAGKTTSLRLILGLLRRQQGSISIFGKPFAENRIAILKKVGALIESPSLYGHLTATENLRLLQRVHQCPANRITDVLTRVGLSATGSKRAGQFSLGMKQRLGIAMALLHQPDLLILDEPTNGLDPNGILEMRELLKTLHQQHGTTILISSHLLAEIERLVTHIGIIHKGTMMFQGTLQALKSMQQQSLSLIVETNNAEGTRRVLDENKLSADFRDGKFVVQAIPKESVAALNHQLVANGIDVYGLTVMKNDLESIFMELINQPL